MENMTVSQARKELFKIVNETDSNIDPIEIIGKNNSVVVMSKDEYESIQETLHALSIPGFKESASQAMDGKNLVKLEDVDF